MPEPVRQSEQPTWHAMPAADVIQRLEASAEGVTPAEAGERLERFGPNALQTAPGPSVFTLVLKQFRSPLIYMLLAAAVISVLANPNELVDAIVILAVVVLNTVVGVLQEWRAEKALEALRSMAAPHARVIRTGEVMTVPAVEVIPGDVLLLEAGDRVAADARVLEIADLQVDESALTGESQPVAKRLDVLPERTPLADRANMVWMSTAVTNGRGRAMVTTTGMGTMMGEIAQEVRSIERSETPLQRRIAQLGTILGVAAIGLSMVIFLIGLLRGFPILVMLLFAVAAAVSAIPEGLPAVISVVLALGVQRMAARHAIIRRLPAVETLGSTTIICSDKTGTITRNEMTVTRLAAGGRLFEVTGEGFAPEGEIRSLEADRFGRHAEPHNPDLEMLHTIGSLANDATLTPGEQHWRVQGDPTEVALLVAARKGGMNPTEEEYHAPRIGELPFASARQYMATLHRPLGGGRNLLCVKGAPERLLDFSTHVQMAGRRVPLTAEHRAQILGMYEAMGGQALRVLAGAYAELSDDQGTLTPEAVERGLTFVGLWGMLDPPRPEAIRAITAAHGAGIRVVMITGDHAVTASAIARQVGIAAQGEETVSGDELERMPAEELRRRVARIGVYARVSPTHKLRIVDALRQEDEIAAMTGDGVNDAPALKRANIGIAMGITGTEVAKEAADMVLTDDNFATIVNAVEEGRVIYNNLQKVIFYLVTTNLGEIITLTAALVLGLPLPLTPVMILWVNLVTDGVCTIPLGVEPEHGDVLKRPPRAPQAGILDWVTTRRMLLLAPLMAAGTLFLFWQALRWGYTYTHAQTIAFTTLVAFQWFHAVNARSHRFPIIRIGLFSNRWHVFSIILAVLLQLIVVHWPPATAVFDTVALSARDWGYILLVSSSIWVVDEVLKVLGVHRGSEDRPASTPSP